MSKKINRLIDRRVLRKLLREQQANTNTNDGSNIDMSDYKKLGFKDVSSNPKALEIENPGSENTKQIFKNSNLPERPLPDNPYYVAKDHYEELIKTNKLGKSAKDLGLKLNKTELTAGDTGLKTYKKLSDNEYQLISAPFPNQVGDTFNLKYEFTSEQLEKLPKNLNKEKGNMFRQWVNDNKTKDEIKDALEPLPSLDKTLGKTGSFTNDHFRLAYITFKDEYDKHLKRFDTDNAPAFMGFKKAETGKGINNDYYKFVIDDVAVAIDTEGNILQRPRGGKMKDGKPVSTSYVAENKRIRRVRTRRLNERKLDVSYIVGKIQKGIESGNIKGMKEIPQGLKDIVKKKAGTVKKTVKSKSTSKKSSKETQIEYSSSGGYEDKLAKVLRSYEGFRSNAYKDTRGIPTIGIGATWYPETFEKYSGKVQMGQKVTEEEALFIKAAHVAHFQKKINSEIGSGNFNSLPDGVKAALQSKAFNYGSLGKTLSSKVKEGIKLGDFSGVSRYFRNVLAKHNEGTNSWRRNDEAGMIDFGYSKRAKIKFDSGSSKNKEKGDPLPYVYIADSQGRSGLGLAIRKRLGTATAGTNFFQKNGATAAAIMNEFGSSIDAAVSNTQNIIFTLGGNGSSKASFLARDVLLNAPESAKITWILAPPAVKPTKKTTYVNTPGKPSRQVDTFKATRARYNREIVAGIRAVENKLGMPGRINVIDPYPWFEQNVSSSDDGVHVDREPGEEYVATIETELQPNQSSENLSENRTRKNKMIITESQLRRLISNILLENKTEDTKFIQKTIGAKDDGIWGEKTDEKWVAWVDKNIDSLIKASGGGIKKDSALKFKKNAAQLASLILNDPSKKSIAGVAEMIKLTQDPEAIKNKQAAEKKAKNLSTGGKLIALKGPNSDGTYPALPDKGVEKPYYKFILDTQVFAFDPNNKEQPLKQRERGTGGDYSVKAESASFERVLGIKLVERFMSPGKIIGKIKDGEVSDPKGVFRDNKEEIQNAAKSIYDKKFSNKAKILDPSEYEIQKSEDGAPNVPAVRKFVAAAKEEMGMVFNSLGRSAADQARISFQGPYANDALIRKIDPSIPPGTYYFSNHPKGKENLEKINSALKKLGKSSVSKGVYGAYGSSTYMPIFKNYEKALKDVQKVGATGKSALGDTGKSAWEATIPFWEKIAKSQKARGKKGHMTGYGIDIPRNTSKERLIQLNDIANRFGLRIDPNTKPESDHFHLNIYELKPSDLEKINNKKEKANVSESKNKRRRLRRRR